MSDFDDKAKQALSDAGAQCGNCGDQPGDRTCPDCEHCYRQYVAALRAAGWASRTEMLREAADAVLQSSHGEPMRDAHTAKLQDVRLLRGMAGDHNVFAIPAPDTAEYGIAFRDSEFADEQVLDPTWSRAAAGDRLAYYSGRGPARLVSRTVRYGAWTDVATP
jgi:hypothetical protein